MAFRNSNSVGGLNVDMNVTPLIDVLLVLLIIFMVIVPVTPSGLHAQVPQVSTSAAPRQEDTLVVQIATLHNGQLAYKINQDDVPMSELGRRLNAMLSVKAEKVMFIKAEASLEFSAVIQVMDIGRAAGAEHIGLLTPKAGI